MKSETEKSLQINRFIGLGSEAYAYQTDDSYIHELKGNKISQSKETSYQQYYNCLFDYDYSEKTSQNIFRSIHCDMYMQK